MRVRDIIRQLEERYDPDDHLVIAWWPRHLFRDPHDLDPWGGIVQAALWNLAVEKLDRDGWQTSVDPVGGVYDVVQRLIDEVSRPEDGR